MNDVWSFSISDQRWRPEPTATVGQDVRLVPALLAKSDTPQCEDASVACTKSKAGMATAAVGNGMYMFGGILAIATDSIDGWTNSLVYMHISMLPASYT